MTGSLPTADEVTSWVATGLGSWPGVDIREATSVVVGELPDWPHLVELPARGPGADLVGRTLGQLSLISGAFAGQTSPAGWRRAAGIGADMRRAQSWFRTDCDVLEEYLQGYQGPVTVALAGPWTVAATLRDVWGERILRDRGFTRDLTVATSEVATAVVADFQRRLPAAQLRLQLDEPFLDAVHEGTVPFSSGYRRHEPVAADELASGLLHTATAARAAGAQFCLHSCGHPVWPVYSALAPDFLSLDVTLLTDADTESWGTWLEWGAGTIWGVWTGSADRGTNVVTDWLHRLGLSAARLGPQSGLSPTCGLAGVSPEQARAALAGCREIARRLSTLD